MKTSLMTLKISLFHEFSGSNNSRNNFSAFPLYHVLGNELKHSIPLGLSDLPSLLEIEIKDNTSRENDI